MPVKEAIKKDPNAPKDAEVSDYIARAERARKRRADAPDVWGSGGSRIEQKEMIERYSRDFGGPNGERHYTFLDADHNRANAEKGYMPVVDNGDHVHCQGDPMWWIPTEDHIADLENIRRDSERLLRGRRKEGVGKAQPVDGVQVESEVQVMDGEGNLIDGTRIAD